MASTYHLAPGATPGADNFDNFWVNFKFDFYYCYYLQNVLNFISWVNLGMLFGVSYLEGAPSGHYLQGILFGVFCISERKKPNGFFNTAF